MLALAVRCGGTQARGGEREGGGSRDGDPPHRPPPDIPHSCVHIRGLRLSGGYLGTPGPASGSASPPMSPDTGAVPDDVKLGLEAEDGELRGRAGKRTRLTMHCVPLVTRACPLTRVYPCRSVVGEETRRLGFVSMSDRNILEQQRTARGRAYMYSGDMPPELG